MWENCHDALEYEEAVKRAEEYKRVSKPLQAVCNVCGTPSQFFIQGNITVEEEEGEVKLVAICKKCLLEIGLEQCYKFLMDHVGTSQRTKYLQGFKAQRLLMGA